MIQVERLEEALRSSEPASALRALVLELAAEGHLKVEILESLEKVLLLTRARDDHSETDEDAVLDVMDALAGWCHPDARLLPD